MKERYELNDIGASLIALAIIFLVYPAFVPIFLWAVPNAQDGFWERLAFTFPSGIAIAALLWKPSLRKYGQTFASIGYFLAYAHIVPLLIRNHLNPTYVMGFYVVVNVSVSIFTSIPIIFFQAGTSIVGAALICYFVKEPQINLLIFFSLLVAEATLSTFVNVQKLVGYLKIEKQNVKLQESEHLVAVGLLAAGVAHEINNPLAVIVGNAGMVNKKLSLPEFDINEIKKMAETINRSAQRIAAIVASLLQLSRDSADSTHSADHSIVKLIEHAVGLISSRSVTEGVVVQVDCDDKLRVRCDMFKLVQVILALLENSYEAVLGLAEQDRWIKVKVQTEKGHVMISIIDSGRGIDPSVVGKLFLPFFTTREVGAGQGLSLSVAKSTIEKMGGSLDYNPKHPNTRFDLLLRASSLPPRRLLI